MTDRGSAPAPRMCEGCDAALTSRRRRWCSRRCQMSSPAFREYQRRWAASPVGRASQAKRTARYYSTAAGALSKIHSRRREQMA